MPIAAILIALAIVLVATGLINLPSGISTNTSCVSPCGPSGTPRSAGITLFAGGIAFAEGYWDKANNVRPCSRPARNNNPGDFVGAGDAGQDCGGYAIYSSIGVGWQRIYNQLNAIINGSSRYYNLDLTIAQMGNIYSPGSGADWANNVAYYIGGSTSDTLRQWLT
jgi:hypothetical protein